MLEVPRLDELEGVIERGLQTFVEVGNAIREIRDSRLYKQSHETFEDYCRERWGWSDSRARQLIGAAGAVETVTTVTVPGPANERMARELAPLAKEDPETARRVWGGLTEEHGDDLTAKHVKKAVEEVKEAKARRETLPPEVRTIVEGSDPDDTALSRSPAQLKHLGDIAAKRGPERAAETAERVANGEFKNTFDAYPEVKAEAAPEPPKLPPKTTPPGVNAGYDSIRHFRALTKHDPKEAASAHSNKLDPNAVQNEIERAQEAVRWLEAYVGELRAKTRLSAVK
ncbi:MAG: hypothetical protein M3P49_08760 [Actinomycetota bacterium]|nr:hypothetical protein [Actinomycetota bacterium]